MYLIISCYLYNMYDKIKNKNIIPPFCLIICSTYTPYCKLSAVLYYQTYTVMYLRSGVRQTHYFYLVNNIYCDNNDTRDY